MAEINLMPTEGKSSENLSKIQKTITVASVFVLVVVAVCTVATLVMFTTLKSEEAKQKGRVEEASTKVNSYQTKEELLTVVSKKVDIADKALSSRLIYTDILKKLANLMPTNVYFGDLTITGDKMTTSAKAKTSADVAKLVSNFVSSEDGKKLFSSVTIDSLASVSDPETKQLVYSFSLSMQVVGSKPAGEVVNN